MHFGRRFHLGDEDLVDAFQEAIIAFYEYCIRGKYDQSLSSPKTMIFTMGKYALLKSQKQQSRSVSIDEKILDQYTFDHIEMDQEEELTYAQMQIKKGLEGLNEKCQQIIKLFYLYRYSIEAIVEELGYQNENVVRSHKSRCLKRLRDFLQKDTSDTTKPSTKQRP